MTKNPRSPMKDLIIVIASFIAASVINIYPMDLQAASLRPMALIMVLAYWVMLKPGYVGIVTAFTIGICADLLLDTRLGQQAFCAVIMAFSIRFIGKYLKHINLATAWLVAAAALSIFQICLWSVQYLTQNIFNAGAIYGLLTSICTWPLIYLVFDKIGR